MSCYRHQIESAIRATLFHSPTTYSWFCKFSQRLLPSVKRALSPQSSRDYLHLQLQMQLYNDFYCQGTATPAKQEPLGLPAIGMTAFVRELSAANTGNGYWDHNWEILAVHGNHVVVRKGGLTLRVRPEDYLLSNDSPIMAGMRLSLRFPKEFLSLSPGFYMASGTKNFGQDNHERLVRFYWNLSPEGAVRFMRSATFSLNRADLPFQLKALNDPVRYTRCDAVVLYIRKSDYHAASEILGEIYDQIAPSLGQRVPVFTKQLANGVGLAEAPGQGASFGLQRSGVLAEGMIRANEQGKKSVKGRLEVVEACFAQNGVSIDKPFLESGSSDIYNFQPHRPPYVALSVGAKGDSRVACDTRSFLRTAAEIGHRLSQGAVWHGDRCNWLGEEYSLTDGIPSAKSAALGPELYSGTSGVALFLAELHAATGDAAARRAAIGSIRQALSRADGVPFPARFGLYAGWLGIALAAARLGMVLKEEEILSSAAQLLQRAVNERKMGHEFDIISGNAGAVAALVAVKAILDDVSLLDFAGRLADELLKIADKSEVGWSWKSPLLLRHRNLTGFSHGTAGVAYALLELFHATSDSRYREGAEQAFNYERHWFDVNEANWPDFREAPTHGERAFPFSTTWCSGAPGIALSRLSAYQILKNETCKKEAMIGLRKTYKTVEGWLRSGAGSFSLCHGLAGNADVLLYGSQVLGEEWPKGLEAAYMVAEGGTEMWAKRGQLGACETGGYEIPGLMLGLAGIGYFYLRLWKPTVPSILIPQAQGFGSTTSTSGAD